MLHKKRNEALKNPHWFLSYTYSNIFSFLLIAFAAFIVYSNSFDCQFHFDDENSITGNHQIRDLSSFYKIDYWLNLYRPLSLFSFALNYHLSGLDVFGYHLVNLLIHIITGFFVFLLIKLILNFNNYENYKIDKHKNWFALLSALIFVVHPIQTQAIIYIVQRMTSMAAMFYIISVYLYALGRIKHIQNGRIFKAIPFYSSALVFGVFGVMTKQSAATFPFAFLLFEFCFIRSKENKIFKKYILLSLSALILIYAVFLFLNGEILAYALHGAEMSSMDYLINQIVVIVKYLQLVLLPVNQCADYGNISNGFPFIRTFWRFDVVGCFLLLIGLFTSAVYLFKKNRAFSFGIFWFFLTLSVESSIIPIADPMFEHRMYLPMVGMVVLFMNSVFMIGLKLKTSRLYSFIALIILILGILSYSRNEIWKNDLTLWTDVIEKAPNNARAWYNLGVFAKNLKRNEEAIKYFDRAIVIRPEYCSALLNKGVVLASLGKQEEAIKCYDKVIEIEPNDYQTWNNKGSVLENMGNYKEAILSYDKAIEIKPDYDLLWYNKGVALSKLLKHEEAIISYDKAIEINPGFDLAWYNKGDLLSILGKYKEAVKCYNKAIEINPDAYEAWNNKGTVLEKLGKYEEAIISYDKAIGIKLDFILAWYNKGTVLEKLEKYEEAILHYNKALQIQPNFAAALKNKLLVQQKIRMKK